MISTIDDVYFRFLMSHRSNFVILLIICLIFLFIALAVLKPTSPLSGVSLILTRSGRSIIYGSLTCETWKNFSFVNRSKYQTCLGSGPNGAFWSVEGIRHTAHRGLLDASSLIVEVGGNRGHDTIKFIELYNASIINYEPLTQMWSSLVEQFRNYSRVEFHPYGLGGRARSVLVELNDAGNAGTSIFRPFSSSNSSLIQRIHLLDIVAVMEDIRQTRTKTGLIDMLSINCEGCEFEIIPALILNDMLQYFRIIQFASHKNLVPASPCIYCQIEQALEQTHQIKYHYHMLWEGWVLKNTTVKP